MYYTRRRRSWFSQWNYYAPFIWFADWIAPKLRKICKFVLKLTIVLTVMFCIELTCNEVGVVFAEFTNEQKIKKLHDEEVEREAKRREEAYKQSILDEEKRLREDAEYRARVEKLALEERERELEEEYLYNYVEITWCRDISNGPDMPIGNSHVGQVTHIEGSSLYGSWGDYNVDVDHGDHCHIIGCKRLNEIRKEEAKIEARKNKKKQPFKSWGIYPGTTSSK